MSEKDTVIFRQPTQRTRLFLCMDGNHVVWTPHDPDAKLMPDGITPVQFRATTFTQAQAYKTARKFTGRVYVGVL